MRKRVKIILPYDLIVDRKVSANAVRVYAVLKSFIVGTTQKGVYPAVCVSHNDLCERCNLSHHTVVKSLKQLEKGKWIYKQNNSGSANVYIFTNIIFDS